MIFRKSLSLAGVAVLLLSLGACTGCMHQPAVPLTPSQSAVLTLNQTLAVIATLNKAVATDVIALNNQGLLKKEITNSILSWQKAIAEQVLAAETIQRSQETDEAKAVAIKNAFASIVIVPPDIAGLLKSPQTDQAVIALVTTIESIVNLIRSLAGV